MTAIARELDYPDERAQALLQEIIDQLVLNGGGGGTDVSALAKEATLQSVLTELQQKLEAGDLATLAKDATLASILTELQQKLEVGDLATLAKDATLSAILTELQQKIEPSDLTPLAKSIDFAPLAQEATLAVKFGGGKTTVAGEVNVAGDSDVVIPAAGKRIRLLWVGLSTSEANTVEVQVAIKFGTTTHYLWNMGAPGAFSHWEPIEGAADESLVINLSDAQPVLVNITYEEF